MLALSPAMLDQLTIRLVPSEPGSCKLVRLMHESLAGRGGGGGGGAGGGGGRGSGGGGGGRGSGGGSRGNGPPPLKKSRGDGSV